MKLNIQSGRYIISIEVSWWQDEYIELIVTDYNILDQFQNNSINQ